MNDGSSLCAEIIVYNLLSSLSFTSSGYMYIIEIHLVKFSDILNMYIETLKSLISPKFSKNDLVEMVKNYSHLEGIDIENVVIAPPSNKVGDSYLSQIIRFKIDAIGTDQRGKKQKVEVNVITKALPPNLGRRKTFRSHDFFENEIIFYTKVWPSMRKFFQSKGLDKEFYEIVPLLLAYCLDGENDYLSLEDLSVKNYHSVERGKGIDYDRTMQVLNVFSKFHALSLAYKDQSPVEFSNAAGSLKETYFSEKFYAWYRKMQEGLVAVLRDATKKELPQNYFDKIDKVFKDDFYKKTCDVCEKTRSHLSGVTQGDNWIPNFLFQQEGDNLHITMIDFQLARWAPFSTDVTYFLSTCVEESVLWKHWDDFIDEYTTKIKHHISLLGSSPEIFSGTEFRKDIKKNFVYTVAATAEALTMSLVEGFDLELIKGDESIPLETVWAVSPFDDKERRERVANIIKFFVDKEFI